MKDQQNTSYPLDNSAIIHLAARTKKHTNAFCITITLKEFVHPQTLQQALDHITPRFPTIIAGIQAGVFQYRVVPAKVPPCIRQKQECLAPMTKKEIKSCAFRVLYHENQIVTEFFHSLTDGHGGMVVANTLVAEYLRLKHGVSIPVSSKTELLVDTDDCSTEAERADDYVTYAGKKMGALNNQRVFQIQTKLPLENSVRVTSQIYAADKVLDAAHHYGVNVTTFLCAVMAASIIELQNKSAVGKRRKQPVQIMVPVDLRHLFPSRTLRNFSLFALPGVQPEDAGKPFEELIDILKRQFSEQITPDYMAAIMATHTRAEHFPLFRILPLALKILILRFAHILYGENSSCISLSNLGVVPLEREMSEHIKGIDFILTPRIKSPYNCGIVSFDGILSICFSRYCTEPELEAIFCKKMEDAMQI